VHAVAVGVTVSEAASALAGDLLVGVGGAEVEAVGGAVAVGVVVGRAPAHRRCHEIRRHRAGVVAVEGAVVVLVFQRRVAEAVDAHERGALPRIEVRPVGRNLEPEGPELHPVVLGAPRCGQIQRHQAAPRLGHADLEPTRAFRPAGRVPGV
jgi:hypothetical protein